MLALEMFAITSSERAVLDAMSNSYTKYIVCVWICSNICTTRFCAYAWESIWPTARNDIDEDRHQGLAGIRPCYVLYQAATICVSDISVWLDIIWRRPCIRATLTIRDASHIGVYVHILYMCLC